MSNEFDVAKRSFESLNSAMAGGSYAPKEDKFDIDKMRAEMNSFKPLSEDSEEKEDDSVNEALVLRWLGVSVILDRTGWDLMKEADAVGRDHVLGRRSTRRFHRRYVASCNEGRSRVVQDRGQRLGSQVTPLNKRELSTCKLYRVSSAVHCVPVLGQSALGHGIILK